MAIIRGTDYYYVHTDLWNDGDRVHYACASSRQLFDGHFTRTQLCAGIFADMAAYPCTKQQHMYDMDIAEYECKP